MKLSSSRSGTEKPAQQERKHRLPVAWSRRGQGGRIRVHWKVLIVYLVLLLLSGWVVTSTGLYFYIKTNSGYTEVRYRHILGLPFTSDVYRKAKGEFWVEQGMLATREGRWREAFDLLRLGLPFAPEKEEARITLARIFLMAGRPDMAKPVLLEGLQYNTSQSDYLRSVLGYLFSQQADETVVEVANNLLGQDSVSGDTRRMLAVARMYAYFNRDQYEAARFAAKAENLVDNVEGQFIEARIAWETGLKDSALLQLRALHGRAPQDGEIYRTLVYFLREAGKLDEARRVILARQIQTPDSPDAYVDLITLYITDGEEAKAGEGEAEFLRQFGDQPAALLKLAVLAAQKGRRELAWRIVELCQKSPPDVCMATVLAVEAEITAKAFAAAGEKAREVGKAPLPWTAGQRATLLGFEAVAFFGQGQDGDGQGALSRSLDLPLMPASALTTVGKQLRGLGKTEAAGRALQRAIELDPLYQAALVEKLRLELDRQGLAEVLALVQKLPGTRKPPAELMTALVDNLESDRYLYVSERGPAIESLRVKLRGDGK